jgi:hypothetical protein
VARTHPETAPRVTRPGCWIAGCSPTDLSPRTTPASGLSPHTERWQRGLANQTAGQVVTILSLTAFSAPGNLAADHGEVTDVLAPAGAAPAIGGHR